jgi:hypothetical protein
MASATFHLVEAPDLNIIKKKKNGFISSILNLIVLSAGFAHINFRLLKLPNAIGLMLVSLIFSFFILIMYYFLLSKKILPKMDSINFSELLLESMLFYALCRSYTYKV